MKGSLQNPETTGGDNHKDKVPGWCDSAQVLQQMDLWWSGLLNFETPPCHAISIAR